MLTNRLKFYVFPRYDLVRFSGFVISAWKWDKFYEKLRVLHWKLQPGTRRMKINILNVFVNYQNPPRTRTQLTPSCKFHNPANLQMNHQSSQALFSFQSNSAHKQTEANQIHLIIWRRNQDRIIQQNRLNSQLFASDSEMNNFYAARNEKLKTVEGFTDEKQREKKSENSIIIIVVSCSAGFSNPLRL